MDTPVSKVRKVLRSRRSRSAGTPISEEEDSHLGDFIEDRQVVSLGRRGDQPNLKEQTDSVLKTLTPREEGDQDAVRRRRRQRAHAREVGQSFAVTRERIRQIEAGAAQLRHPSRSRKLRAFLEGRT